MREFDGTVSLNKPLIAPIYDGRTVTELLATINGNTARGKDHVKAYWTRAFAGQTKAAWTLRDAGGQPFLNADVFWRHALHDGFVAGTSRFAAATPAFEIHASQSGQWSLRDSAASIRMNSCTISSPR